jgi:hypothetical protein
LFLLLLAGFPGGRINPTAGGAGLQRGPWGALSRFNIPIPGNGKRPPKRPYWRYMYGPKSAGPVPDFPRKLVNYPIFRFFDPFSPKKIDFPPIFPEIPGFFRGSAIVAGKSLAYLQKSLAKS